MIETAPYPLEPVKLHEGEYLSSYPIFGSDGKPCFQDGSITFVLRDVVDTTLLIGIGEPDQDGDTMVLALDPLTFSGTWQEYHEVDGKIVPREDEGSGGKVAFFKGLGGAIMGVWSSRWDGEEHFGSWRLQKRIKRE